MVDLLILGFLVTRYLKEIGFDENTDTKITRVAVNAYMQGYAQYTHELCGAVEVSIMTQEDGSLFVILKGE